MVMDETELSLHGSVCGDNETELSLYGSVCGDGRYRVVIARICLW